MKKIAFTACSDGLPQTARGQIDELCLYLKETGYNVVLSPYLYIPENTGIYTKRGVSAQERAKVLIDFFKDNDIEAIYDISGGDIANEILPYLDFEEIKKHPKRFYGYSDVTTICNAIYTKTGIETGIFQIKTLVWDKKEEARQWFIQYNGISPGFSYYFIQNSYMEGILTGGNIRCFLKLAGTEYFPDCTGKIILLEARSGRLPQIITYLAQLQQTGVFNKASGILLGTFTEVQQSGQWEMLLDEVKSFAGSLPVAVTPQIGHGADAKCAVIGRKLILQE